MSRRLTSILVIALVILVSLTLAACEKERPVPTPSRSSPLPARGTATVTPPPASQTSTGQSSSGVQSAPVAAGTVTPTPPPPQPVVVTSGGGSTTAGQSFSYTVVAGDTLAVIANRFKTTPEAIVQLNGLTDPNTLALGQVLKIPGTAPSTGGGASTGGTGTTGTSGATSTYVVQAGDTLGKIAIRYGTTVAELLRLNQLSNPNVIAIGQKLIVPAGSGAGSGTGGTTKPATGSQGRTYIVQKGDTLLSIARRYGLTVKQLQSANNISNPDRIYPGQTLTIP